jgi:hypothetical protein
MIRTLVAPVRRPLVPLLLASLMLGAVPAKAAPGGLLRVLLKGYWICETGGDATTPPTRLMQDSFRIIADSSYRTTAGAPGTYLLLGNDLVMTGGPFIRRRYILVGQGILHPLDAAGKRTSDRCVRQSSAATMGEDGAGAGAEASEN